MVHRFAIQICSLGVSVAAGCASAPQTTLHLQQPAIDGPQQHLDLASDLSWGDAVDGALQLVLAYPLPGSRLGSPQFEVYLRLPAETGSHRLGAPFAGDMTAGFLLQRTGRLRGMTPAVAGEIVLEATDPPRGQFHVECADGAAMQGRFTARASREVRRFAERHEADIALAKREVAERQMQLANVAGP